MLIKENYFIEDVAVVEETEEVPRCLPKETICFLNLADVFKSVHHRQKDKGHTRSSKIP